MQLVFGNESDGKKKQMTEVPLNLVWCLEVCEMIYLFCRGGKCTALLKYSIFAVKGVVQQVFNCRALSEAGCEM